MKQLHSLAINISLFFSQKLIGVLLCLLCSNGALKAQNELDVIRTWIQFSDAPNALYHDLSDQAYNFLENRTNKISGFHSLLDWQNRQQWITKRLREIVGPFPERTPLKVKVLGKLEKDGYSVENIIYESQPGFYVSSSLFLPVISGKVGKGPAIIYCSGHSNDGYRNNIYQHTIINLVKKGFIVFAFDPIAQGERLEYFDPKTGKSIIGAPDEEHSYSGAQPFITGSSLARYMIWDGMRAVDYLLTRKEVDPDRIGITGRSGGGTKPLHLEII